MNSKKKRTHHHAENKTLMHSKYISISIYENETLLRMIQEKKKMKMNNNTPRVYEKNNQNTKNNAAQ